MSHSPKVVVPLSRDHHALVALETSYLSQKYWLRFEGKENFSPESVFSFGSRPRKEGEILISSKPLKPLLRAHESVGKHGIAFMQVMPCARERQSDRERMIRDHLVSCLSWAALLHIMKQYNAGKAPIPFGPHRDICAKMGTKEAPVWIRARCDALRWSVEQMIIGDLTRLEEERAYYPYIPQWTIIATPIPLPTV